MKIQKTNIAFGTSVKVGYISASTSLPKFKTEVTKGLLIAAKKLSENGINDQLVFNFRPGKKGKNAVRNDVLELGYWAENAYKSSKERTLLYLEKLTPKKVAEYVINSYEKLKTSRKKGNYNGYPVSASVNISPKKESLIKELTTTYGYDDWTCA